MDLIDRQEVIDLVESCDFDLRNDNDTKDLVLMIYALPGAKEKSMHPELLTDLEEVLKAEKRKQKTIGLLDLDPREQNRIVDALEAAIAILSGRSEEE